MAHLAMPKPYQQCAQHPAPCHISCTIPGNTMCGEEGVTLLNERMGGMVMHFQR